jgi:hypothetical protein
LPTPALPAFLVFPLRAALERSQVGFSVGAAVFGALVGF